MSETLDWQTPARAGGRFPVIQEKADREDAIVKHCPKCRMESRSDADWCWHCGYSYEDAESRTPPASGTLNEKIDPTDSDADDSR